MKRCAIPCNLTNDYVKCYELTISLNHSSFRKVIIAITIGGKIFDCTVNKYVEVDEKYKNKYIILHCLNWAARIDAIDAKRIWYIGQLSGLDIDCVQKIKLLCI